MFILFRVFSRLKLSATFSHYAKIQTIELFCQSMIDYRSKAVST